MPSSALRAGNARPYECFRSSGDERRGDHWSPESLPLGEGIRCGGVSPPVAFGDSPLLVEGAFGRTEHVNVRDERNIGFCVKRR